MTSKFFAKPVRASFILRFASAFIVGLFVDIWSFSNLQTSFLGTMKFSFSTVQGFSMSLFAPILFSTLTALLVLSWSKTEDSLSSFRPLKILSNIGFVGLYLGATFLGFMGIFYLA